MIAVIYVRKSTDDSDRNEETRSTTRQIERATEYATAKGWTVDPRYIVVDDAVSGAEWKHGPGSTPCSPPWSRARQRARSGA